MDLMEYITVSIWTIFVLQYGARTERSKYMEVDNVLWHVVYYTVLIGMCGYFMWDTTG